MQYGQATGVHLGRLKTSILREASGEADHETQPATEVRLQVIGRPRGGAPDAGAQQENETEEALQGVLWGVGTIAEQALARRITIGDAGPGYRAWLQNTTGLERAMIVIYYKELQDDWSRTLKGKSTAVQAVLAGMTQLAISAPEGSEHGRFTSELLGYLKGATTGQGPPVWQGAELVDLIKRAHELAGHWGAQAATTTSEWRWRAQNAYVKLTVAEKAAGEQAAARNRTQDAGALAPAREAQDALSTQREEGWTNIQEAAREFALAMRSLQQTLLPEEERAQHEREGTTGGGAGPEAGQAEKTARGRATLADEAKGLTALGDEMRAKTMGVDMNRVTDTLRGMNGHALSRMEIAARALILSQGALGAELAKRTTPEAEDETHGREEEIRGAEKRTATAPHTEPAGRSDDAETLGKRGEPLSSRKRRDNTTHAWKLVVRHHLLCALLTGPGADWLSRFAPGAPKDATEREGEAAEAEAPSYGCDHDMEAPDMGEEEPGQAPPPPPPRRRALLSPQAQATLRIMRNFIHNEQEMARITAALTDESDARSQETGQQPRMRTGMPEPPPTLNPSRGEARKQVHAEKEAARHEAQRAGGTGLHTIADEVIRASERQKSALLERSAGRRGAQQGSAMTIHAEWRGTEGRRLWFYT